MTDKPLISFDYAIKYLLKDKGDYEIVEGFISALLKCSGYGNVKIIGLLDTESNKEDKKSKRSLADLIVEDEGMRNTKNTSSKLNARLKSHSSIRPALIPPA
ncbi:MAG: hypothetical protein K0R76_1546 [Alphaproteobacteria bacterium]|nr:hypothetical protein [Alphaproteobacteria bacterium]